MPDAYRVEIVPSARRELEALHRPALQRVVSALRSLSDDPRSGDCRKLVGSQSRYRRRAGNYRIVYEIIDESKVVRVYRIRHRSNVYR